MIGDQFNLRGDRNATLFGRPEHHTMRILSVTLLSLLSSLIPLILRENLLNVSDAHMALPRVDFQDIYQRGIAVFGQVELSADRQTLSIAFDIKDGVNQIHVPVASDNNLF